MENKFPGFDQDICFKRVFLIASIHLLIPNSLIKTRIKRKRQPISAAFLWAQLGSNQRPPDYESGAANHLSYGPDKYFKTTGPFCGWWSTTPVRQMADRDAANHLSYGPDKTGCKYNIKLKNLQTKFKSVNL